MYGERVVGRVRENLSIFVAAGEAESYEGHGEGLFITPSFLIVWKSCPQMPSHNEYVYVVALDVIGALVTLMH